MFANSIVNVISGLLIALAKPLSLHLVLPLLGVDLGIHLNIAAGPTAKDKKADKI